jgi:hypothetical protein
LDAPLATNVPFVVAKHASAPQVGTLNCLATSPAGRDQTAGTAAAITAMYVKVFMMVVLLRRVMRSTDEGLMWLMLMTLGETREVILFASSC